MSILIIRDFPPETKRQMKLRASKLGVSLNTFVVGMLDTTFTSFEARLKAEGLIRASDGRVVRRAEASSSD